MNRKHLSQRNHYEVIIKKNRVKIDQPANRTIPLELPEPRVKTAVEVIDHTGMEYMTVINDP